MGNFIKQTNIRLIANVIAHEIGHFIANILLQDIESEPEVENIVISWDDSYNKPWGRIEYTIKEGVDSWLFPKDENLCYYTILSLYSGCIWEKFSNCIFHKRDLSTIDIQGCYETSGNKDAQAIGIINNKHLKMRLTKEFADNQIIKPYAELLNGVATEKKQMIYDFFTQLAIEIESSLFDGTEPKEYQLTNEQIEKIRVFILNEFIIPNKKELIDILSKIKINLGFF